MGLIQTRCAFMSRASSRDINPVPTTMTSTASKDQPPLPLAGILRDLALLRASDVDIVAVLPDGEEATKSDPGVEKTLQRSYEFVREARATLRMQNRGDLDGAGDNLERIREGLEDVLKGLEGTSS